MPDQPCYVFEVTKGKTKFKVAVPIADAPAEFDYAIHQLEFEFRKKPFSWAIASQGVRQIDGVALDPAKPKRGYRMGKIGRGGTVGRLAVRPLR